MDVLGVGGHVAPDGLAADLGSAGLEGAGEIPLGEDPGEGPILRHDDDGSGTGFGHAGDRFAHRQIRSHLHEIVAGAHDVAGPQQKSASQRSAGMQLGEVFLRESARLEQDHGEGIAHHERVRRARGRGEIERAGLAAHVDVEDAIGRLAQGRARFAGDGDEPGPAAFQMREQAKELRRFPRITEGDDAVAGVDKPKIAVDRILTIEDGGGGPGRVQGGGEFAADVAGFPDPDDEDLRPPLNRGLE